MEEKEGPHKREVKIGSQKRKHERPNTKLGSAEGKSPEQKRNKPILDSGEDSGASEYEDAVEPVEPVSSEDESDMNDSICSNTPLINLTRNRKKSVDIRKRVILANQNKGDPNSNTNQNKHTQEAETNPEPMNDEVMSLLPESSQEQEAIREPTNSDVMSLLTEIKINMVTKDELGQTLENKIKGLFNVLASKQDLLATTERVSKIERKMQNIEIDLGTNSIKTDQNYADQQKAQTTQNKVQMKINEIDETQKQDRLTAENEYIAIRDDIQKHAEALTTYREKIEELENTVQTLKIRETYEMKGMLNNMGQELFHEFQTKCNSEMKRLTEEVNKSKTPTTDRWPILSVIVDGLIEGRGRTDREHIISMAQSMETELAHCDLLMVTRLGARGRFRPLEIVFTTQEKRNLFYKNRTKLRRDQDYGNVWVNPHESKEMREKRGQLRRIAKQAHENGSTVTLTSHTVKLDGIEYSVNDIAHIPTKYLTPNEQNWNVQSVQKETSERQRPRDTNNSVSDMEEYSDLSFTTDQEVSDSGMQIDELPTNEKDENKTSSSPPTAQENETDTTLLKEVENPTIKQQQQQQQETGLEEEQEQKQKEQSEQKEQREKEEEKEKDSAMKRNKEKLGDGKNQHKVKTQCNLKTRDLTDVLAPLFIVIYGMIMGFCSRHAFLSNFFAASIKFNGKPFKTNEHAYQYEKAVICKDFTAARRIVRVETAKEAKDIGKYIVTNSTWEMVKNQRMHQINKCKYLQNLGLAKQLIDTYPYTLAEMTSDPYWGTGSVIRSDASKNSTWTGQNRLGQILMSIREEIRREIQSGKLILPQ